MFATAGKDDYAKRVIGEKRYFEKLQSFSRLPEMVEWWSAKYLKPRVQEIFGYSGGNSFYLRPIIKAAIGNEHVVVASLGSGDGEVEIALAQELLRQAILNVQIIGFELSKDLASKATNEAEKLRVSHIVAFENADINSSLGSSQFDLIIANQVLHHVVMLEDLLDSCYCALKDDGLLMTRDMIGKNGHQSWPEAKHVVDIIWNEMPDRYKWNVRSGAYAEQFPNTDFSHSGFEGIRSQDILPLINERFGYSHFYAFGGIVERFINRSFGQNYLKTSAEDTQFVDCIQHLNDYLIDSGRITPTQMAAYFTKKKNMGKHWQRRSPEKSVRAIHEPQYISE
ncbi:hypothetical protein OGCDGJMD_02404 [Cyanobium usitatum str. Tous]|uniref:class I SAM-dependent methyltransferase n=1 Tax=Cyanobium usitatum TaxID=2304190 RepID=UPI002AD45BD0|nr:class I SAM-dependent methyltransferase [Cyanobium usitatum]CAK6698181.1 hypothetical protein OGCDGJMD_02404 [Cyanobium usitatum str. Tous]